MLEFQRFVVKLSGLLLELVWINFLYSYFTHLRVLQLGFVNEENHELGCCNANLRNLEARRTGHPATPCWKYSIFDQVNND